MAEKLLIAPPETVISLAAKLDVASLEVKVRVSVASLVVAPSATALEPSVAVIAMVGPALSLSETVLFDWDVDTDLPTASKILFEIGTTLKVSLPLGFPE